MATRTIYDCDRCKAKDLKFPVHLYLKAVTSDNQKPQQERVDLCLVCAQEILQGFISDFDLDTSQRFIAAVRETPAAQPRVVQPKPAPKVLLQQEG